MEQRRRSRARALDLVGLLLLDWRPTVRQALWAVRISLALGILVLVGHLYGVTLWQWAQLLIVPAAIAAGGAWFNSEQNARGRLAQDRHAQHDAFQKYVDYVSHLITDKNLYRTTDDDFLAEARITVRAQTLAVLTRLSDPYRKASVLQFIHEAGLISGKDAFLSLLGANLQGANLGKISSALENINLTNASLDGANFVGASMRDAHLRGASLVGADLTGADLTGADLRGADLTDAVLRNTYLWNVKLGAYVYIDDYDERNERPVSLENADLTGARLWGATGIAAETLEQQAGSLKGAVMPDGSRHG